MGTESPFTWVSQKPRAAIACHRAPSPPPHPAENVPRERQGQLSASLGGFSQSQGSGRSMELQVQVLLLPQGKQPHTMRLDQVTEAVSAPLCCVTPGSLLPSLAGRFSPWNCEEGNTSRSSPICRGCHQDSLLSCFLHGQSLALAPPASKSQGWKSSGRVPVSQAGKLRLDS